MSVRANHATSPSADANSSRQALRRRALTRSGMPTASAITIAARTHHNQEGGASDSAEVGSTDGEVVGDGAAVVWVGWVVGVGVGSGAVVFVGSDVLVGLGVG